jgi:hypothetical protein
MSQPSPTVACVPARVDDLDAFARQKMQDAIENLRKDGALAPIAFFVLDSEFYILGTKDMMHNRPAMFRALTEVCKISNPRMFAFLSEMWVKFERLPEPLPDEAAQRKFFREHAAIRNDPERGEAVMLMVMERSKPGYSLWSRFSREKGRLVFQPVVRMDDMMTRMEPWWV